MKAIKAWFIRMKELNLYMIFGMITTAVNYIAAILFYHFFDMGELTANNFAWVVSVAVAYITNKLYVFESKSFAWRVVTREVISFFSARLASLLVEDLIIWIMGKFGIYLVVSKLIASVFVVVMNYFFSRYIFKKNRGSDIVREYETDETKPVLFKEEKKENEMVEK